MWEIYYVCNTLISDYPLKTFLPTLLVRLYVHMYITLDKLKAKSKFMDLQKIVFKLVLIYWWVTPDEGY